MHDTHLRSKHKPRTHPTMVRWKLTSRVWLLSYTACSALCTTCRLSSAWTHPPTHTCMCAHVTAREMISRNSPHPLSNTPQKWQMFVFVELNKSNYADIMFEAQTLSIDRKNNTSLHTTSYKPWKQNLQNAKSKVHVELDWKPVQWAMLQPYLMQTVMSNPQNGQVICGFPSLWTVEALSSLN